MPCAVLRGKTKLRNLFHQLMLGTASTKMFVCLVNAVEIELDGSAVCEACGEATLNTEVSNHLSVDLHQGTKEHSLSIQKSLYLFFTPEKLSLVLRNARARILFSGTL